MGAGVLGIQEPSRIDSEAATTVVAASEADLNRPTNVQCSEGCAATSATLAARASPSWLVRRSKAYRREQPVLDEEGGALVYGQRGRRSRPPAGRPHRPAVDAHSFGVGPGKAPENSIDS